MKNCTKIVKTEKTKIGEKYRPEIGSEIFKKACAFTRLIELPEKARF